MADEETKQPDVEADGYYGEEDMGTEDLDLSFLDEPMMEAPEQK